MDNGQVVLFGTELSFPSGHQHGEKSLSVRPSACGKTGVF
jgi:hypothetical protein